MTDTYHWQEDDEFEKEYMLFSIEKSHCAAVIEATGLAHINQFIWEDSELNPNKDIRIRYDSPEEAKADLTQFFTDVYGLSIEDTV